MQKGSILSFSIILSVIIISIIVAVVLIFRGEPEITDNTPITDSLNKTLRLSGITGFDRSKFDVVQRDGRYARIIYEDANGQKNIAFAFEIKEGEWQIVEYGNPVYSCEEMTVKGFPPALITDCTLTIKNSITTEDAIKDNIIVIDEENNSIYFVDTPEEPIIITGTVTAKIKSEDGTNKILVTSNNTTVPIEVNDQQINTIEIGDNIAVTVDVSQNNNIDSSEENNTDNSPNNNAVVIDIIEIDENILNQIDEEVLSNYNLTQEEFDYYYEIYIQELNEPYYGGTQYIPEAFFQLLYDIDNSNRAIQIIGD